ncbi:hypothetical protein ACFLU6_10640 [Acidobacteriota bacterium]
MYEEQMVDELRSLEGKNASQICYTNLRYDTYPPIMLVLDAATMLRDDPYYKSSWIYLTQLSDGATLWKAPDGSELATVRLDGAVNFERI